MRNGIPEVSVDFEGLYDHLHDEVDYAHESITNYNLEMWAESHDYRNLDDDLNARFNLTIEDRISRDGESVEISVDASEYFSLQNAENVKAFERLTSELEDDIAMQWKIDYTPDSGDLLELVEEIESSGPVWNLDLMEDKVKASISYDPRDDSFKVEGPFASAEGEEVTESHPAYIAADRILTETGLDSFSD